MLTQERLKYLLDYDLITGNFTRKVYKQSNRATGKITGTIDKSTGYVRIYLDGKLYHAHRLAFLYVEGEFPDEQVDHINTIRSENSWKNLRKVTSGQNSQNIRKKFTCNSSGYLGVDILPTGRYRASIRLNRKTIHIGVYATGEEAYKAYLEKKAILHPYNTLTGEVA